VEKQEHVSDAVIQEWLDDPDGPRILKSWNPNVTIETIESYINTSSLPNVFSPFHLIAESIAQEHVYPSVSNANLQVGYLL
jgi:hypothetical protein